MGAPKSTIREEVTERPVATAGPSAFAASGAWSVGGAPEVPAGTPTAAARMSPPMPSASAIRVAGPRRSASGR